MSVVARILAATLIAGLAGAAQSAAVASSRDGSSQDGSSQDGSGSKGATGLGAEAVARLARLRPDIPIERVQSTPIPGMVALVVAGGTLLYATEDGRYLFAGDLYELTETDLVNVAEAGRVDERRAAMASVDPASMIIFPASGVRRASINVFTDVDCGYCQKLHLEVPALNELGIEVRYLGYPRAGIGSDSYDRIVSAWCAKDPRDALTRVKAGEDIPAATCDNRIAEHFGINCFKFSKTWKKRTRQEKSLRIQIIEIVDEIIQARLQRNLTFLARVDLSPHRLLAHHARRVRRQQLQMT